MCSLPQYRAARLCERLRVFRNRRRLALVRTVLVVVSTTLVVYHLLAQKQDYVELGCCDFNERDRQIVQRQLIQRKEAMGLKVSIASATPAA